MSNNVDGSDARAGFVRQRRFLIGTSLTIFGYEYLGLSVKQINVLGNNADMSNPGHLAVVLVVIHGWAIYRYWTHFQELAPWLPFRDARLERWRQLLTPSNWNDCHADGEKLARLCNKHVAELERLREKGQIDKHARAKEAHLTKVTGGTTSTMHEEWNVPFYCDERKAQVGYVTLRISVGAWRSRRALLLSWILMLVNRSFFSEYIVPLGLAAVAVIAYATNWFESLG
jgi:hypothetical protein